MASNDYQELAEVVHSGDSSDRSIVGELCQITYVVIWISSLCSPFLLLWLLLNHYYSLSLAIAVIVAIAYIPQQYDHLLFSPSFRHFMFCANSKYYENISLCWTRGSQPTDASPTLLCVHPHGIFCQTWGWLYVAPQTVSTVFMFSNTLFASPFFRLFSRIMGNASGCDKVSMRRVMASKTNCAIIPGGFHDASIHSATVDRVCLRNRKGFVKYAIEFGYSLTPVFGFGEKDTFYNVPGAWSLRLWLNDFGIPGVLPFGRWFCPILPRNRRLHVVVDSPLPPPTLKENEKVTREMVDKHHAAYVEKLKAFHKKYSKVAYGKEAELEIW